MFPPLFATLNASNQVKALLGSNPLRVFPAGEAPQDVTLPYGVFQTVFCIPELYLGKVSDMDVYSVQVDVYATTLTSARNCASAIRTALDAVAYVTSLSEPAKDPTTNHYRYSLDVDFHTPR